MSWQRIFSGSENINSGTQWNVNLGFNAYKKFKVTFTCQGFCSTAEFITNGRENSYSHSFGYLHSDGGHRLITVNFTTAGRYFTNVTAYMQYNTNAWANATASVYITDIYVSNAL